MSSKWLTRGGASTTVDAYRVGPLTKISQFSNQHNTHTNP